MLMREDVTDIIEAQIEKFDALREEFCDENIRCFLLKRGQNSGAKTDIQEVTAGWYFRWSEYRQQMKLSVATLNAGFADTAAQATHFGVGVPDGDGQIDVYVMDDERRDRVPPNGASPYWKFYLLRLEKERFTVT